jgi:hypothetical protein
LCSSSMTAFALAVNDMRLGKTEFYFNLFC